MENILNFNNYFNLVESNLTIDEIKDIIANDILQENQVDEIDAWLALDEDVLLDSDLYESSIELLDAEEEEEVNEEEVNEEEVNEELEFFFLDENFEDIEDLDTIEEEAEVHILTSEENYVIFEEFNDELEIIDIETLEEGVKGNLAKRLVKNPKAAARLAKMKSKKVAKEVAKKAIASKEKVGAAVASQKKSVAKGAKNLKRVSGDTKKALAVGAAGAAAVGAVAAGTVAAITRTKDAEARLIKQKASTDNPKKQVAIQAKIDKLKFNRAKLQQKLAAKKAKKNEGFVFDDLSDEYQVLVEAKAEAINDILTA